MSPVRMAPSRRTRRFVSVPPCSLGSARRPTVTVVIPNYNYARFLPGAVHSALTQVDVSVEVIIVDDASTDESAQVAADLVASDGRISFLAQHSNRGPVDTFNHGLERVRSDYLVRLDADDLLTPGSLVRSVALAEAYPRVGLVYGHPVHFTEAAQSTVHRERGWAHPFVVPRGTLPPARTTVDAWLIWNGLDWLTDRCRTGLNVITSPEVLMRRSVVDHVGGQRQLAHTHDMEMWLRIAAYSDIGYVSGADQAWHREHPDSLSTRESNELTDLRERGDAFTVLFDGVGDDVPDGRLLLDSARRALAMESMALASHEFDRARADAQRTAELMEFAASVWSPSVHTKQWRALESRRRSGTGGLARTVSSGFAAAQRRLEFELRLTRWERRGH